MLMDGKLRVCISVVTIYFLTGCHLLRRAGTLHHPSRHHAIPLRIRHRWQRLQLPQLRYSVGKDYYSATYAYTALLGTLPNPYTTTSIGYPTYAEGVLICAAARGDPLFTGLYGQQFCVAGVDGQVLNIISTATLQLNGRFVTLSEGESITPAEQEKMRTASQQQHATIPDMAVLPLTEAWSHLGNYFGEAGVALLDGVDGVDGHRLYAKAGPYSHGFAKLTLDGQELPMSSGFTVLGSGSKTYSDRRLMSCSSAPLLSTSLWSTPTTS